MSEVNTAENGTDSQNAEQNGNTFTDGKPTPASGRIPVAKKDYDVATGDLSVLFGDGTKREINLGDIPGHIVTQLAMHGLSQKLGDSYASVKGNIKKAVELFDATLDQLKKGEWAKARGEGEGGARVTELAEAIARFKNVPIEKAQQVVASATDENVKAWKASPKIKAVIAQIRYEKAAKRAEAADEGEEKAGDESIDALNIE
jgi:hypothetical protein